MATTKATKCFMVFRKKIKKQMKAMKAMKVKKAETATLSGGAVADQIAVVDWDENEEYVQKHGIYYKPGPAGWESQHMFSPGWEDQGGQFFAVWQWHGWVYWPNASLWP